MQIPPTEELLGRLLAWELMVGGVKVQVVKIRRSDELSHFPSDAQQHLKVSCVMKSGINNAGFELGWKLQHQMFFSSSPSLPMALLFS